MSRVTDTDPADVAKEFNGIPSNVQQNDMVPGGETATASSTTDPSAPAETKSNDKEDGKVRNGQDNIGGQPAQYVDFAEQSDYVYYTATSKSATFKYTLNDIVLKNISWQTTDQESIGGAFFKSEDEDPERTDAIREASESQVVIELDDTILKGYFDKTMEILVNWESEDKKVTGNTRSRYFSVSNRSSPDTALEAKISSAAAEVSLETAATATSAASETADLTNGDSSSGGSGGLSTGAKAGIAVGAVIGGLLIIGALAFFLLRRRRRSKQLGEDYTSQQAYTVDKETHGRATDSPNSPYSDENQVQPVALQNISHDHDEQTARGTPTPSGIPRTSTGSRNAPTPQGMSSNVAHLVEDGMTAEEIRRLEEEERQLDDEIERAARR